MGYCSPILKKWGLYWICPVCPSVILSICHSVIIKVFFLNILRMNGPKFVLFFCFDSCLTSR